MKTIYLRFLAWSAVILWMIIIFCLSAQPAAKSTALSGQTIRKVAELVIPEFKDLPQEQQDIFISDFQNIVRKTAHFLIFLVLGGLCITALLQHSLRISTRFIAAIIICTGYAVADEIHQLFVPGRSAQIGDVMIDCSGVLIGICFVLLAQQIWSRRQTKGTSAYFLRG